MKRDAIEHGLRAVGLVHVLQLEDHAPALRRGRKLEVNLLPLGRHLEALDFVEHLDAALDLRRLGRLIPEAIDEFFDALNVFVLAPFRFAQALEIGFALLEILRVVGVVLGDLAQRQVGDVRDDGIEEVAVVRDHDDGSWIRYQIFLEPVTRLEIEMIGRLVEQQQIGLAEQQLRECEPHLPSAGEVIGELFLRVLLEAEAA